MEKLDQCKLSIVFNFSVIVNILPYFGSLPKWMWLMTSLHPKTKCAWEHNKEAFLNCGKDYKVIYSLNIPQFKKEWRIFVKMLENFKYISVTKKIIKRFPHRILNVIIGEKVLLLKIKSNSHYPFNIFLTKECNISNYLPSVKCPNYQRHETVVDFTNDSYKTYFSNLNIEPRTLILRRTAAVVRIDSVKTPDLQIEDINTKCNIEVLLSDYLKCPIDYCCCKPTVLKTKSSIQNSDLLKHILENIKTIKMIKSKASSLTEIEFESLLFFLDINKAIKVSHSSTRVKYSGKSTSRICLKTRSLVFVKNSIPTLYKIECPKIYLEGTVKNKIVIDGQNWIAFKPSSIQFSESLVIEYDQASILKIDRYHNQLYKYSSKDISDIVLFKAEDIYKLEDWDSESLAILSELSKFKRIRYEIHIFKANRNSLINKIDLLLRDSNIEINFNRPNGKTIPKLPLEFWKVISEFKNNLCIGFNIPTIIQKIRILKVICDIKLNDLETIFLKVILNGQEQELNLRKFHQLVTVTSTIQTIKN